MARDKHYGAASALILGQFSKSATGPNSYFAPMAAENWAAPSQAQHGGKKKNDILFTHKTENGCITAEEKTKVGNGKCERLYLR